MIDPGAIPVAITRWTPSYRLIPSRYPTVGLYDAIADPADLDAVFAIEALTNPRIRDELGRISLVLPAERLTGPGASMVMAAFTHLNPDGSRFSDGSYGVYYAAQSFETALAEVSYHRARFMAYTAEPAIDLDMRLINADVEAPLHDLRDLRESAPVLYDPNHYGAAQVLGRQLRARGSWGVQYHSVRYADGLCVGILRPRALANVRAAAHIALHWDGHTITHWYEKRDPQAIAQGAWIGAGHSR